MERYVCGICGWQYSDAAGCPDRGVSPGTRWFDVPADFECPECSASKDEFSECAAESIYVCSMCGFRYEEAKGSERAGLPAGTSWDDVDPGFKCPLCGCGKNIFKRLRESNF